jgi:hypothetical protein
MTVDPILPVIDELNRPFWDGCKAGKLCLQRCTECGHLRYPISLVCPRCMSTDAAWTQMQGRGEVYSFAVFRHAYNDAWRALVPYNVALVQLTEGPTLISNVIDVDLKDLRIGLPVTVVFEPIHEHIVLPRFAPWAGPREAQSLTCS